MPADNNLVLLCKCLPGRRAQTLLKPHEHPETFMHRHTYILYIYISIHFLHDECWTVATSTQESEKHYGMFVFGCETHGKKAFMAVLRATRWRERCECVIGPLKRPRLFLCSRVQSLDRLPKPGGTAGTKWSHVFVEWRQTHTHTHGPVQRY